MEVGTKRRDYHPEQGFPYYPMYIQHRSKHNLKRYLDILHSHNILE